MTDTALQYYKDLKADIEVAEGRIRFLKQCLKNFNGLKWSFQIQDPDPMQINKKHFQYHLSKGTVRGVLLDDLRSEEDYLKTLKKRYADNDVALMEEGYEAD